MAPAKRRLSIESRPCGAMVARSTPVEAPSSVPRDRKGIRSIRVRVKLDQATAISFYHFWVDAMVTFDPYAVSSQFAQN